MEKNLADKNLADEGLFDEDNVVFLSVDQVSSLHEEGIRRYSPAESLNILDKGRLESAVMTPQQTFGGQYLYQTLCSTFLRLNGYRLTLSQDEAVDLTLRLISHELTREDVVIQLGNAIDLI